MRWLDHVGTALSQLLNAILFGFADESLSSRSYRSQHKRRWRVMRALIDAAFWPIEGAGHCERAYWREMERWHSPPEMREKDE